MRTDTSLLADGGVSFIYFSYSEVNQINSSVFQFELSDLNIKEEHPFDMDALASQCIFENEIVIRSSDKVHGHSNSV